MINISPRSLLIPDIGVFAGERMEAGTFLGIYSGELITEAVGEARKLVPMEPYTGDCADDTLGCTTNTAERICLIYEATTTWSTPSTSATYVVLPDPIPHN